jgi:hypothetical protein
VDTRAIDCLVPASVLKRIGIKPEGRDVYELANGETTEYAVGFARVRFMGSEAVTKVIWDPRTSSRSWAWWRWRSPGSA